MNYKSEVFKLPCGYLDENKFLYTHIEVREMTGREEDILANRKAKSHMNKFSEIIAACCTLTTASEDSATRPSLGLTIPVANALTQGDRMFAFLKIRQVSYGNSYKFQFTCDTCNNKNTFEVDLNTIESKEMPSPDVRHYDCTLPSCGDVLTFKISTGEEEIKMFKMLESNPSSEPTINLASRLLKVNGETVSPISYLKQLSVRDRQYYRDEVEKVEGGVETSLSVECGSCGSSFNLEMPIQESFFLPTSE